MLCKWFHCAVSCKDGSELVQLPQGKYVCGKQTNLYCHRFTWNVKAISVRWMRSVMKLISRIKVAVIHEVVQASVVLKSRVYCLNVIVQQQCNSSTFTVVVQDNHKSWRSRQSTKLPHCKICGQSCPLDILVCLGIESYFIEFKTWLIFVQKAQHEATFFLYEYLHKWKSLALIEKSSSPSVVCTMLRCSKVITKVVSQGGNYSCTTACVGPV